MDIRQYYSQYLYLSPETCLLRHLTQSFTGGECMEPACPNLFQPTALVGAIAIAMGFSTSVSAQDSLCCNASLEHVGCDRNTF